MEKRLASRKDAREQLRDYVRATLFRTPLPGTVAPELALPRRPGYQSHIPTCRFEHATVLALSARLPERQRALLVDLAECSVAEAARRRGCSVSTLRRQQEAALDWLLELLNQQSGE